MLDTESVKDFMLALVKSPELQPYGGRSFCNIGARRDAQFFGCHDFDNQSLLADDMVQILKTNSKWTPTYFGEIASKWARIGGLAFAAMSSKDLGEAHGHIAGVFPAQPFLSPSVKLLVPMLANVGAKNDIMPASECFPVDKWPLIYYLWNFTP